ncbi:hypothetical protein SAMD00023353_2200460 [Rosellinia necatrix]|uniref:Uncharacterized protein n=1 Tax=Rosellinia necatrix TaxID=77044 RepID=A0A1S8A7U0_ROSNE|nr:hypothetical protein SAMD00023353_2200460 [Rosellinia necatrix]
MMSMRYMGLPGIFVLKGPKSSCRRGSLAVFEFEFKLLDRAVEQTGMWAAKRARAERQR